MKRKRKFGETLTRILANPLIQPLAKIVLRNELEREIKRSKGGCPKGYKHDTRTISKTFSRNN
jgi:hypothetical protein